jgi:hypothetical protein
MELMNAVGEVLQSSFDGRSGTVDPAAVALNLQRWLAAYAGLPQAKVDALEAQVTSGLAAHGKLETALASAKERYAQLQSQQTSSVSRQQTAPLEAELTSLAQKISGMETRAARGQADLTAELTRLQQDGLKGLSEFIVHGKRLDGGAKSATPAGSKGAPAKDAPAKDAPAANDAERSARRRRSASASRARPRRPGRPSAPATRRSSWWRASTRS